MMKMLTDSFDLGFCSVDIVETTKNEFLIMELNSGVMMTNYMDIREDGLEIAKNMYRKAIMKMFEK